MYVGLSAAGFFVVLVVLFSIASVDGNKSGGRAVGGSKRDKYKEALRLVKCQQEYDDLGAGSAEEIARLDKKIRQAGRDLERDPPPEWARQDHDNHWREERERLRTMKAVRARARRDYPEFPLTTAKLERIFGQPDSIVTHGDEQVWTFRCYDGAVQFTVLSWNYGAVRIEYGSVQQY